MATGLLKNRPNHLSVRLNWRILLLLKMIFFTSHFQNHLFQCVLPLSIHNYEQHIAAAQSKVK